LTKRWGCNHSPRSILVNLSALLRHLLPFLHIFQIFLVFFALTWYYTNTINNSICVSTLVLSLIASFVYQLADSAEEFNY